MEPGRKQARICEKNTELGGGEEQGLSALKDNYREISNAIQKSFTIKKIWGNGKAGGDYKEEIPPVVVRNPISESIARKSKAKEES